MLALYTLSGAMNALMRAVNKAYGRRETRNFIRQRLTALAMIACFLVAAVLVVGLLVLGPVLSGKAGSALASERDGLDLVDGAVADPAGRAALRVRVIYVLAPDIEHARFDILAPGTIVAVVVWLVASGGFSVYVATFASYNKTWGSLAAVIVLMTWLWLSSVAILLGAEINSEAERSRELRSGLPAEDDLQAPTASGAPVAGAVRAPCRRRAAGARARADRRARGRALGAARPRRSPVAAVELARDARDVVRRALEPERTGGTGEPLGERLRGRSADRELDPAADRGRGDGAPVDA